MNLRAFQSFRESIAVVRGLIDLAEAEERIIAAQVSGAILHHDVDKYCELPANRSAERRQRLMVASTIMLYGAWELFVDESVREFVAFCQAKHQVHSDLPKAILDNHGRLTYRALSNSTSLRRYRLQELQLVGNMHTCLTGAVPYQLNAGVFVQRTSNSRIPIVDELCGNAGIGSVSKAICDSPILRIYFTKLGHVGPLNTTVAFTPLNNLVDDRNDVSHGSPNTTLSNQLLLDRIEYVSAIGAALNREIIYQMASVLVKRHGVKLGLPIHVYGGGSIPCLGLVRQRIAVGDWLFAGPTQSPLDKGGEIISLQVGNHSIPRTPNRRLLKVGIGIDFICRANHEITLVPARFFR
jgi:hypothetical protein